MSAMSELNVTINELRQLGYFVLDPRLIEKTNAVIFNMPEQLRWTNDALMKISEDDFPQCFTPSRGAIRSLALQALSLRILLEIEIVVPPSPASAVETPSPGGQASAGQ